MPATRLRVQALRPRISDLPPLACRRERDSKRGIYCLGVHFTVDPDLDVPRSEVVCSVFE